MLRLQQLREQASSCVRRYRTCCAGGGCQPCCESCRQLRRSLCSRSSSNHSHRFASIWMIQRHYFQSIDANDRCRVLSSRWWSSSSTSASSSFSSVASSRLWVVNGASEEGHHTPSPSQDRNKIISTNSDNDQHNDNDNDNDSSTFAISSSSSSATSASASACPSISTTRSGSINTSSGSVSATTTMNTTSTGSGNNSRSHRNSNSNSNSNSHNHNHNNNNNNNNNDRDRMLRGIILDHAVDLRSVRPGDRLDIPYELTVSEALQDFWFAAFFDQARIHTSRPFCRLMGLQDRIIPFSLALFLTSSMSHADAAKVQVGFGKVHYLWPAFAGDTFRRRFTVQQIRNTSDGNHSVIYFQCDLINQRDRICMRADKRLLFPFSVPQSNVALRNNHIYLHGDDNDSAVDTRLFRDHILSKATTVLAKQPSHSLARLVPGQLILHTMHRSLTFGASQQLASIARLTHERHFDTRKYDVTTEILIPGGLVLGLTMSATARDLHEVLHEEIVACNYINSLHPDNIVGAISYIHAVDENLPGDLEVVTVTTLGIKNVNIKRDLFGMDLPVTLFQTGIYSKEMEKICKESCPALCNKIVVQVQRKILRQARHREVFLL